MYANSKIELNMCDFQGMKCHCGFMLRMFAFRKWTNEHKYEVNVWSLTFVLTDGVKLLVIPTFLLCPFHTTDSASHGRSFTWWWNHPKVAPFCPSCSHYRGTATDWTQFFSCK